MQNPRTMKSTVLLGGCKVPMWPDCGDPEFTARKSTRSQIMKGLIFHSEKFRIYLKTMEF